MHDEYGLSSDSPHGDIGLNCTGRIQFQYVLDNACLLGLIRCENSWRRGSTVKLVQFGLRNRCVPRGDVARKFDVAIKSLQRLRNSITHLATVESPIVLHERRIVRKGCMCADDQTNKRGRLCCPRGQPRVCE
jgi:hypothetical protein